MSWWQKMIGRSEKTNRERKILYLHSPKPLVEKPVNLTILEVLFGVEEVVTMEITLKQPDKYGRCTSAFDANIKLFDGEYRLISLPGCLRPKPAEELNFVHGKIIGTLVAFKWFNYQTQEGYRDDLRRHLEIALSGKTPVMILIDLSPPTEHAIEEIVEEIGESGLAVWRIEERPLEEALTLYKLPEQSEIDAFTKIHELSENKIMRIDTTQYQSVFDAVRRSISFFESQAYCDLNT